MEMRETLISCRSFLISAQDGGKIDDLRDPNEDNEAAAKDDQPLGEASSEESIQDEDQDQGAKSGF